MTELRWRWLAQAQLIRDEFSKHRCLGQEYGRLLKAAKRTVSRSFLCLGFFVCRSVMPAEVRGVIRGSIVLLPHVYVTACVYMWTLWLVLNNLSDRADRVICINNYHSHVMAIW